MYLHFDQQKLIQDFRDVIGAVAKGLGGYDKHQSLAQRTVSPTGDKKNLRMYVVVNCIDCAVNIEKAVETVWERGNPISVSLADGTCPKCKGKSGFHYADISPKIMDTHPS